MKIAHQNWFNGKPVEVTSVVSFVDKYVKPWDYRGAIEDTEYKVEKLQELVSRFIEVTATKLQFDATDLSKILDTNILDVSYETPLAKK
jgi:hypothetical protein